MLVTAADLNGHSLRVLFDTGAPHSMLTAAGARLLGVRVDSNWSLNSVSLTGVGEVKSIGSIHSFDTLGIGDEVQHHVALYVTDIDVPRIDMIIGMDFFMGHRVYVDNGRGALYFVRSGDH